jgi:hypothetical protein
MLFAGNSGRAEFDEAAKMSSEEMNMSITILHMLSADIVKYLLRTNNCSNLQHSLVSDYD